MSGSGGSTFALSGRAVIALAIGCLLIAGLAFAAGWLLASKRAAERVASDAAGAGSQPETLADGTPAAPAASAPAASAPAEGEVVTETWSVRLGAFLVEEEAEVLLTALAERGYQPYEAMVAATDGGRRARTVLVGPYAERDEAIRVATSLQEREGLRAVVVLDDARPAPLLPVAAQEPPEPPAKPASMQAPAPPEPEPPPSPSTAPSQAPPLPPSTEPPATPAPSPAAG